MKSSECSYFASFIFSDEMYNANWFDLYLPIVETISQSILMQIAFE